MRRARLPFKIMTQPNETTCGPTCLHSIYAYFGDNIPLEQVIEETHVLKQGGTLGVYLAHHALQRGYSATIYTYNLHIFDPSWFQDPARLVERLRAQSAVKSGPKLREASEAYIEFLENGGSLRFRDLTTGLLRESLTQDIPILTGLSATYLYRSMRETPDGVPDDVNGKPVGHFVVLCGYDRLKRTVDVADPYSPTPPKNQLYHIHIERLLGAVMLGIATYDSNIMIIRPRS
jgi:hypothetical protein